MGKNRNSSFAIGTELRIKPTLDTSKQEALRTRLKLPHSVSLAQMMSLRFEVVDTPIKDSVPCEGEGTWVSALDAAVKATGCICGRLLEPVPENVKVKLAA